VGQTVAGLLWLGSAALGTWGRPGPAIVLLVVGGMFIFPLTRLGLGLLGGRGRMRPENPLGELGWQVAFTLPLCLPVVGAATLYRLEWFYPAFMIVLGAHYLPFAFLYGMRMFIALCALLVGGGFVIGWQGLGDFALGAWLTGALLLAFAALGLVFVRREALGGG
jgi:hypothetical protein